jgi:hypothetical protein
MSKVWIILALLIPSIGHCDMAWEFAQRWQAAQSVGPTAFRGITAERMADLYLYYGFDADSGGVATDSSGNDNDGSYLSGTGTTATNGFYGAGLVIAAAAHGVEYGTTNSLGSLIASGVYTVGAWLWSEATPTGARQWAGNGATDGGGFSFGHSGSLTNSTYNVITYDASGSTSVSAGGQGGRNQWRHVVAASDGTTMRLYLNGSEVASGSVRKGQAYAAKILRIGGVDGAANFGNGWIDEFFVMSATMGADEIGAMYTEQLGEVIP